MNNRKCRKNKKSQTTIRDYAAGILRVWAKEHDNLSTGYFRKKHIDKAVKILEEFVTPVILKDGTTKYMLPITKLGKAMDLIFHYLDEEIGIAPDDSNRNLFYGENEMLEHIRMRRRESEEYRKKHSREAKAKEKAREALSGIFDEQEEYQREK